MINIEVKESIKNTIDEYSLFISFPYNEKIINVIRDCPIRYWNKDDKTWEVPVKKLSYLVENLGDFDFDIVGNSYPVLNSTKVELPPEFAYKTTPYSHQIDGINYGLLHDRWLLGDEMGLGKTKQVIDLGVIKKLQKGYKHCLIICGVNGLKWNWQNEVHTHSNESAWILGMRKNTKGKTIIASSEDKLYDIQNLPKDYFIITNIESLRYKVWTGEYKTVKGRKVKEYDYPITDALVKAISQGEISMIAFDEAHKCKNSESDQGSQLLRLETECKIAMTGTPLMNNPLDLYTIFNWLGYEKHSLYSFKKHYCNFGGYGGYEVVGYKNMDEIREKLDSIMLRRKKDEVLDLPEKTYIDEYVDMTPKQKQIYDEVTAEITMNIDQIKMASNPLTELIRMRQATGYTGILSSKIQESAKLDRMEEIVEEAIINGKQIVIFSNWTQMTTPIFQRLLNKGISVGCITGQTKDADRQIISDDFQNGRYQVLLGTTSAMGTGLTLTAGTVEIFMDEPWNKANKVQAEDRCHRIGQTNNLTIYTLLCKDTIDERIHELVENKGAMADAIVDGALKMDRGMVLDYLLS